MPWVAERPSRERKTLRFFDDMLGALSLLGGTPWVADRPCGERETLRLFMIECAPLSCRQLWFAITALGEEGEGGPGIFVTLPDSIVRKGLTSGWTSRAEKPARGRYLLDVELPACEQELLALQQLLEASYATAFDSPT
jgi:hypothetical protein